MSALLVSALCSTGYTSTLLGTSWTLKLDIGLEPGSWMPRLIDGWGASGARVAVDAVVEFGAAPAAEEEELVGPLRQTRVLTARGGGKIVTFQGEQEVTFESGGWCVQRPLFSTSEHEGLLRFWLDCPSGVSKNDVSVPVGERIFFSTGTYDDSVALALCRVKAADASAELSKLESQPAAGADAQDDDDLLGKIPILGPMRRQIIQSESLASARSKCAYYAGWPGVDDSQRTALIAAKGSLSLKRQRPRGYIYLGKFDAEPNLST